MRTYTLYITAIAGLLPLVLSSPTTIRDDSKMVFDFSELTASPSLLWTPCYQNFTCALLEVPRDYANESVGTLNVAIIKKPGATPDAQEVLVNPGGPGGSSVNMVLQSYASIEAKIGSGYSLVGIDPRGINNSEPSSDCFPGYPIQTRNFILQDVVSAADITNELALKTQHQSILAYGKWCSEMYAANGTAKYASTVATAQDMLHYTKLRAKDTGKLPDEAKLWYYGVSYGSILGPTFASLYPDRVGRMVIDGVLELEDYYNGGWENAIDETDKVAEYFFRHCFEAGPALCQFHQNATSWQEIEQRYLALLDGLKDEPIGVAEAFLDPSSPAYEPGSLPPTPSVFKWTDLVSQMFGSLYYLSPSVVLSTDYALVGVQTRDNALSAISIKSRISNFSPDFDERQGRHLVVCLDSYGRSNYTKFNDYKVFVNTMYNRSNYGGLNVASLSGPVCSQMNVQPPESQRFDGVPRVDGTDTPILFVSSAADPVTPLSSARKMNSLFPGSGLLVLNNSGHAAHFQASKCVSRYEAEYMRSGVLPPAGTLCEVDEPNPWIIASKLYNLTHSAT
jgi:pimeloyl-ACP methyl ester carboxylesterase